MAKAIKAKKAPSSAALDEKRKKNREAVKRYRERLKVSSLKNVEVVLSEQTQEIVEAYRAVTGASQTRAINEIIVLWSKQNEVYQVMRTGLIRKAQRGKYDGE